MKVLVATPRGLSGQEDFTPGLYVDDDRLYVDMVRKGEGYVLSSRHYSNWKRYDFCDHWDMSQFQRCPVGTEITFTQE